MLKKVQTFFSDDEKSNTERFMKNCQRIEKNNNYTSSTDDAAVNNNLLDLVNSITVDKTIKTNVIAVAIQASKITPKKKDKCIGKLYHLRLAKYGDYQGDEIDAWRVDSSRVILVNNSGAMSLHWLDDIKRGSYDAPIKDLTVEAILTMENPKPSKANKL